MRIEYTRQAKKEINIINEPMRSRIQAGIARLPAGDIIKLSGYKSYFRLRVGGYRVVFVQIDENELMITSVAPRGQVYKGV